MRTKSIDLTGTKCHKLFIEKIVRKNRVKCYLCTCECGKQKVIRSSNLLNGSTRSCGCHNKQKRNRWLGCGEISLSYFNRIKRTADKRGLQVEITLEQIWELFIKQDQKCALTGTPLVFARDIHHGYHHQTASLDRIDNTKGYILGNVQWIHKDVNRLKTDFPQDKFLYWCKLIAKNN